MSSQVHRALTLASALLVAGCAHQTNLERPATQDNFGVQMAKLSLWREAMFRFQRAVEINPQDAMAHNNLAVAYEANGDFDRARKEYLEALKLDRSNQYIQKNYSRFVEFLSRNKKRQPKPATTAAATPAPAAASAPMPPSTSAPGTGLSGPLAVPGAPAAVSPPPAPAPQPQPVPPSKPPGGAR